MQRIVWPLLLALLLQLVVGSAWAVRLPVQAAACHETTATVALDMYEHSADHPHSQLDPQGTPSAPTHTHHTTDSHHCCAVGLGVGLQPQWLPLPHPAPETPHPSWASLSLRPNLRPPI